MKTGIGWLSGLGIGLLLGAQIQKEVDQQLWLQSSSPRLQYAGKLCLSTSAPRHVTASDGAVFVWGTGSTCTLNGAR